MATTPTTSTVDLAWDIQPNAYGGVTVDLPKTPSGDLAGITGSARIIQSIRIWLLTPLGGMLSDPSWGNPMLNQLLRPQASSTDVYLAMMEQAEASFIADQAADAASGQLGLDEQVEAITDTSVSLSADGMTATVYFTVHTRAGSSIGSQALMPAIVGG